MLQVEQDLSKLVKTINGFKDNIENKTLILKKIQEENKKNNITQFQVYDIEKDQITVPEKSDAQILLENQIQQSKRQTNHITLEETQIYFDKSIKEYNSIIDFSKYKRVNLQKVLYDPSFQQNMTEEQKMKLKLNQNFISKKLKGNQEDDSVGILANQNIDDLVQFLKLKKKKITWYLKMINQIKETLIKASYTINQENKDHLQNSFESFNCRVDEICLLILQYTQAFLYSGSFFSSTAIKNLIKELQTIEQFKINVLAKTKPFLNQFVKNTIKSIEQQFYKNEYTLDMLSILKQQLNRILNILDNNQLKNNYQINFCIKHVKDQYKLIELEEARIKHQLQNYLFDQNNVLNATDTDKQLDHSLSQSIIQVKLSKLYEMQEILQINQRMEQRLGELYPTGNNFKKFACDQTKITNAHISLNCDNLVPLLREIDPARMAETHKKIITNKEIKELQQKIQENQQKRNHAQSSEIQTKGLVDFILKPIQEKLQRQNLQQKQISHQKQKTFQKQKSQQKQIPIQKQHSQQKLISIQKQNSPQNHAERHFSLAINQIYQDSFDNNNKNNEKRIFIKPVIQSENNQMELKINQSNYDSPKNKQILKFNNYSPPRTSNITSNVYNIDFKVNELQNSIYTQSNKNSPRLTSPRHKKHFSLIFNLQQLPISQFVTSQVNDNKPQLYNNSNHLNRFSYKTQQLIKSQISQNDQKLSQDQTVKNSNFSPQNKIKSKQLFFNSNLQDKSFSKSNLSPQDSIVKSPNKIQINDSIKKFNDFDHFETPKKNNNTSTKINLIQSAIENLFDNKNCNLYFNRYQQTKEKLKAIGLTKNIEKSESPSENSSKSEKQKIINQKITQSQKINFQRKDIKKEISSTTSTPRNIKKIQYSLDISKIDRSEKPRNIGYNPEQQFIKLPLTQRDIRNYKDLKQEPINENSATQSYNNQIDDRLIQNSKTSQNLSKKRSQSSSTKNQDSNFNNFRNLNLKKQQEIFLFQTPNNKQKSRFNILNSDTRDTVRSKQLHLPSSENKKQNNISNNQENQSNKNQTGQEQQQIDIINILNDSKEVINEDTDSYNSNSNMILKRKEFDLFKQNLERDYDFQKNQNLKQKLDKSKKIDHIIEKFVLNKSPKVIHPINSKLCVPINSKTLFLLQESVRTTNVSPFNEQIKQQRMQQMAIKTFDSVDLSQSIKKIQGIEISKLQDTFNDIMVRRIIKNRKK